MALLTFHPCAFNFHTTNIRRVGNTADGGSSISGISDEIETTGGGYLLADFTNGSTRDKPSGNHWRAVSDLDAGEKVIVSFCSERLFQPVGALQSVPHSDGTPFDDGTEYTSPGAQYTASADAALRATSLTIAGASELAVIAGEWFSIQHENWGWRAYRVRSITLDGMVTFRPPLREAISAGTALEFDTPRCQMVKAAQTDNTTTDGRFTACTISFKEDMAPPPSA